MTFQWVSFPCTYSCQPIHRSVCLADPPESGNQTGRMFMDSYLHWRRITTNKAMVLAMLIEHLFSFLLNRKKPKTKDTLSRVCQCIAMFRRCSSCVWCRWWSSDMLYCDIFIVGFPPFLFWEKRKSVTLSSWLKSS